MPATRGQGQWALGYREPLNPNEQVKKDSNPLTVKQRILDIYAQDGFDSIDGGDLRGRFRWYGLYTQRAQGIPGGKTAVLEPEELEAPYFMLRIRIDGGRLTNEQLRVIGEISTEYGRDVADITDRQNVQLHWIRIEDVPAIWERLDAVGLDTTEACGDCPRVILGCPLAGVDGSRGRSTPPACCEEVRARYIGDPAFSNLPRKFKTSISGCSVHCTNHEINDVAFVGVRLPDGTVGYDLWVGGGLSTNPKLAVRLGVFVEPARVAEVWAGVCGDLPRLRLPPLAHARAPEVPHGRLGAGEVPPGAGGRVPHRSPARRPGARDAGRRPSATTSASCRSTTAASPSASSRAPAAPAAASCSASPSWPRCTATGRCRRPRSRGWSCSTCPTSTSSRSSAAWRPRTCGAPVGLPPRHDGLHRPGVLQAGDRRDQGPLGRHLRRAREAAARLRRADHDQRQRLPELLRPLPDRRHRPQGLDRRRRGGLPGAPRRAPRRGRRLRPQVPRAQGHRRRRGRLRRARAAVATSSTARRATASPPGPAGPTRPC